MSRAVLPVQSLSSILAPEKNPTLIANINVFSKGEKKNPTVISIDHFDFSLKYRYAKMWLKPG